MGWSTPALIRLRDRLARWLLPRPPAPPGFVEGPPHVEVEEPELELFMDWDGLGADGRGAYAHDEAECRSRRVDLRTETDADPGPLPMEEAPDDITAKHLILAP